jgi:hydrogenase nickel incorporation protein HypA/HybF
MHEGSLIASLLRQVAELAADHRTKRVSEIRIEVGPLAGVEPILLREAFDRLRVGTISANAALAIDAVSLTCHCRNCQLNFTEEQVRFICPTCGDRRIDVISGDGVLLVSCTLEQSEEATIPP